MRRVLLAVLVVFILWSALDFVIENMVLSGMHAPELLLGRLVQEKDLWPLHAAVLGSSAAFVLVYVLLVADGSVRKGLLYGLLYGIGAGLSAGFGSYPAADLPQDVALWGAVARLIEGAAAGVLTGIIVRKKTAQRHWSPYGVRERGDYIKY